MNGSILKLFQTFAALDREIIQTPIPISILHIKMATPIALIGSGIFAKEQHLPAIKATSLLTLKVIYSRSLASAEALAAEAADVELYSEDQEGRTYEDLLKRDDIKAVIIALPIPVQPSYITRALTAGKHVLAEKPLAKDVATARDLLSFYNTQILQSPSSTSATPPIFAIAENFRYMESFRHGACLVSDLGRVLQFRTTVDIMVQPGGKYYETAWRKTPSYQGGFLLDGGVHFVAGTRLLLGEKDALENVSAHTVQLQSHLPPVDTLNAVLRTASGVSGTLSVSFGTTFEGPAEYKVACERGTVVVSRGKVVVRRKGEDGESREEVKEFPDEGSGVKQEVAAWAESLVSGKRDEMQSPEEALKDLEVVEACLKSGEEGGRGVELER